jgi:hypothetical protein
MQSNRTVRSLLIGLFVGIGFLAGCFSAKRPERSQQDLLALRATNDAKNQAAGREMLDKVIQRTKAQYDDYKAGKQNQPPVIDILIISGGGDWGAFGAGFLKGWGRIPANDPMARPKFTAVTGVSTGALIAPFAFIGEEDALDRVDHLYRNPQKDWVKQRWPLYFLPSNLSFAEVPGLEREMKENLTPDMVKRVADAGTDGRILAVNTTNVDDGTPRVFDLVAEARRATETGDMTRIHNVMLASAGIPAAFPFRVIDDELYVDGGVTGNIIYGGRIAEEDSLPAIWQKTYPDVPIPKIRYWVIFNNQIRPLPQVTEPNWPAVIQRSLEMGTRAATLTSMRHLYAMAEISRLKRKADVEVRIVAIPADWVPPKPGVFIKETMNNLADLGLKMGADPASWRSDPPPP